MEGDNGRVTMAVLGTKLDTAIDEIRALRGEMAGVQSWCTESRTRWVHHDKEHQDLNTKKNIGDIIAGAIGIVAGILGVTIK